MTVSTEVASKLKSISAEKSLEKSIHISIAITLFISKAVSFERAASLAGCDFTHFIYLLEMNRIPWCIGDKDGHQAYRESMIDLLFQVDHVY
ncbi:UPF0175 family protein [Bacillus sp. N9]